MSLIQRIVGMRLELPSNAKYIPPPPTNGSLYSCILRGTYPRIRFWILLRDLPPGYLSTALIVHTPSPKPNPKILYKFFCTLPALLGATCLIGIRCEITKHFCISSIWP